MTGISQSKQVWPPSECAIPRRYCFSCAPRSRSASVTALRMSHPSCSKRKPAARYIAIRRSLGRRLPLTEGSGQCADRDRRRTRFVRLLPSRGIASDRRLTERVTYDGKRSMYVTNAKAQNDTALKGEVPCSLTLAGFVVFLSAFSCLCLFEEYSYGSECLAFTLRYG